ncbi:MAG: phosphoglycerate dehydrogenase [Clostridia bacterium]|nr:phosphoglycerate dehydrogenase [Clostridia bacterium]
MFNVKTLNKIAQCGLQHFSADNYTVGSEIENPDAIILRSFSMHEMELPESLLAVARAGAGVNNIPIDKCAEKGIVVFNTPGANANAVKELVITGLLLASRNVVDGIAWAKTLEGQGAEVAKLVEKGKSNYAGPEISGKTLAVIGLGAIGVMVANCAYHLGMDVVGYDPFISVKSALSLNRHVKLVNDINEAFAAADYLTIHVPLTPDTTGLVNADSIARMKDGVRILNFARGGLVDNVSIGDALESGKVAVYVTDFPSDEVLSMKNVIPIPHLGASTPESEDNCAVMASKQLIDYLENGNIVNSVNYPNCEMAREDGYRITIAHKNIPNMLKQFLSLLADEGINVDNMVNKNKKEYAYTIIDTTHELPTDIEEKIKAVDGVLAVRIIK